VDKSNAKGERATQERSSEISLGINRDVKLNRTRGRAAQDKEQHTLQRDGGTDQTMANISTDAAATGAHQSEIHGKGRRWPADAIGAEAVAICEGESAGGPATRTNGRGSTAAIDSELGIDVFGSERGGTPGAGANKLDTCAGNDRGGVDARVMGAAACISSDLWVGVLARCGCSVLRV
jgi:hypothetical protein